MSRQNKSLSDQIAEYLFKSYGDLDNVHKQAEEIQCIFKKNGWTPPPPALQNYTQYIAIYSDFCEARGMKPRISAAEGKAMKEIIRYLDQYTNQDEDGAVNAWSYVFQHWSELSPFIGRQINLLQINKNIVEIINQLKNGYDKQTSREKAGADFAASLAAKLAGDGGDGY